MNRAVAAIFGLCVFQSTAAEPSSVLAHPPFAAFYTCAEHAEGQLPHLGDARGTDCFVQRLVEVDGRTWIRAHSGEGRNNEDWFGWNEPVLAPCDCVVTRIQENANVNRPGVLGKPPAAFVILKRSDDVHFLVAHLQGISVRKGQHLRYGEPFAKVGNNGYSRQPHIHMGAWKGETPLQVQFDQKFMTEPQPQRAGAQQEVPADGLATLDAAEPVRCAP